MLDLTLARQAAAADPRPQPYRSCPGCHQPLPCDGSRGARKSGRRRAARRCCNCVPTS
jgi:hypothetical protein